MKYNAVLLVVKDMEKSKAFYRQVLGLRVIEDIGVNVTLSGGIALQTYESWKQPTGWRLCTVMKLSSLRFSAEKLCTTSAQDKQ